MGIEEKAKEEIPFIVGYAAVRFNGDVIAAYGDETEKILDNVKNIVNEYLKIYRALGEYSVGMPKEILMSTTELFMLIRIFYNEELYQLAILHSDANLGFTRYKLHEYAQKLSK